MSKRFENLRKLNRTIVNPMMKAFVAGKFSNFSLLYPVGKRSSGEFVTQVVGV